MIHKWKHRRVSGAELSAPACSLFFSIVAIPLGASGRCGEDLQLRDNRACDRDRRFANKAFNIPIHCRFRGLTLDFLSPGSIRSEERRVGKEC